MTFSFSLLPHLRRFLIGVLGLIGIAPTTLFAQNSMLEAYTETLAGTVVSFEMVPVPGGTVEIPIADGTRTLEQAPFWISKTEISWDVYDVYAFSLDQTNSNASADAVSRPSKPYVLPGEHYGHQGRPALGMTLKAAQHFVTWLSAKTGHRYELLTETEWEYACQVGLQDHNVPMAELAWTWENAKEKTQPVGTSTPNRYGAHDLLGNVQEWVLAGEGERVTKGGSFRNDAADLSCTFRRPQTAAWNMTDPQLPKSTWWLSDAPFVGFRVKRMIE